MTNKPSIILIDPQLGENIGMVARAMLNCGLTDLRIVRPRDGWPSETAQRAASGALENGVTVEVFDTTEKAVADCHFVLATTARPRDMIKDVYTARSAAETLAEKSKANQNIAVLFGAERAGLQNEDIALANGIITIPLNPDFTSLNLAQAVLLLAYEWLMTQDKTTAKEFISGKTDIAVQNEIDNFTNRLIEELGKHGFFRSEELRPTIERNLINLFSRMNLTSQDTQTLHGIISALCNTKDFHKK